MPGRGLKDALRTNTIKYSRSSFQYRFTYTNFMNYFSDFNFQTTAVVHTQPTAQQVYGAIEMFFSAQKGASVVTKLIFLSTFNLIGSF